MAKRIGGWLFMVGALVVIIAAQALIQSGPFGSIATSLNRARVIVPALIAMIVLGALLLIVAMIHGLVTDGRSDQGAVTLDGRVVADPPLKKGKAAITYWGRTTMANQYVLGLFRGTVLRTSGFYEESGMAELKKSWRSGQWLHVHRYLRESLALTGFLLVVVGLFGTVALASDITILRLLFLIVVAFVLVRTAYAFARA
jgi:hypothetical protein